MEQEDVLGLTANRLRLTAINIITNQESTMAVSPAKYGQHNQKYANKSYMTLQQKCTTTTTTTT